MTSSSPLVVRNNRIFIALLFLCAILGMTCFPCFLIIAITQFLPVHPSTLNKLLNTAGWVVGAYFIGNAGLFLWKLVRVMLRNQVLLDEQGMHVRLASGKDTQETTIAWDHIAAITHKRVGNQNSYRVRGKNGSAVAFDSYTFFRPKYLAKQVAQRAALTIEKET